jgi:hypothetical protein
MGNNPQEDNEQERATRTFSESSESSVSPSESFLLNQAETINALEEKISSIKKEQIRLKENQTKFEDRQGKNMDFMIFFVVAIAIAVAFASFDFFYDFHRVFLTELDTLKIKVDLLEKTEKRR